MIIVPIFIMLAIISLIIGAIMISNYYNKIGSISLIIGLVIVIYMFFDKPIIENTIEDYYNINTVTNKEVITQVCIVNDEAINITNMFGNVFPEGTIIQKNKKSYKIRYIINWLRTTEYSYEYILPTNKKYNEILKKKEVKKWEF